MTIREFINLEADIDTYGDEFCICMCGPIELTNEGYNEWNDVLNLEISTNGINAFVETDDDKMSERAKQFFYSAAGYCSCSNYDKWFVEGV